MEELASAFTSSLGFDGKIAPVTSRSQSHSPLYKAKGSGLSSQDERRRRNLELQKERRKDYIAQVRRIVESDEENEGEENKEEEMESSSSDSRKRRDWYKKHMANQLMLSEWMVDVPPDLEENWLMMLCPKGRRCLVTTNKGTTRAFRKSGHCFKRFPSLLPAGRRRQTGDSKPVVLDCIYSEAEKTFYVLDVMCWMNHPVYDSDSEFRFFWLQAKFSEVPDASRISNINPYAFFPLPCYPCSKATMESVMGRTLPFKVELDGILFYHKQTHYTPGSTPLVGWLKPWMLPGVLHVSVPQRYIDTKPPEEPWTPPAVASEMECTVEEKKGREPKEENAGYGYHPICEKFVLHHFFTENEKRGTQDDYIIENKIGVRDTLPVEVFAQSSTSSVLSKDESRLPDFNHPLVTTSSDDGVPSVYQGSLSSG